MTDFGLGRIINISVEELEINYISTIGEKNFLVLK